MYMSDIARHLGQKSAYKKEYDPSLLVREPRQNNRTYLGLEDDDLPFSGFDAWNAYEVSALTDGGLPLSFVVKLCYPCTNKYIVESKSLKLYFNSFAMTKLGADLQEVSAELIRRTSEDLSKLLECHVLVNAWHQFWLTGSKMSVDDVVDWDRVINLETYCYADKNIVCDTYSEDPALLDIEEHDTKTTDFHSSSLVSCCKVTGQPDSGDVFITMRSERTPTPESLLKYIVSFRNENHFHEEICEAIWTRLYDVCDPDYLAVTCLYSRRGGIDINPVRVIKGSAVDSFLCQMKMPPIKMPRQ